MWFVPVTRSLLGAGVEEEGSGLNGVGCSQGCFRGGGAENLQVVLGGGYKDRPWSLSWAKGKGSQEALTVVR